MAGAIEIKEEKKAATPEYEGTTAAEEGKPIKLEDKDYMIFLQLKEVQKSMDKLTTAINNLAGRIR